MREGGGGGGGERGEGSILQVYLKNEPGRKKKEKKKNFPCKAKNLQTTHGEAKLQATHIASFVDV